MLADNRTSARSSTDRASDYGSEGWEFESLRARHTKTAFDQAVHFFLIALHRRCGSLSTVSSTDRTSFRVVTTDIEASKRRKRGSVRRMGACLQVRVSAGEDPSTGDRIVPVESVPIENPGNERSERAAMNAAEKIRTRLLAEADSLKIARTKSTVGALLDRWLPQHEIDPTTRMNYES